MLKFPVLIADIGGTNARFAILPDKDADWLEFPTVRTADFATIEDAIRMTVLDNTTLLPVSSVLAIAAPVDGDEIPLTNSHWVVQPEKMLQTLFLEQILLLNDFEAQALAVAAIGPQHMEKIGGGAAEEGSARVVLGPGTGLGVAGLIHSRNVWIPVPGEGGHVDIGPRSERDFAVFPHIEKIEGRISAEQILCGRGLVNLYHAVAAADGVAPVFTTPAEITTAALAETDHVAIEAVEIFVTCLGRLAGDLALIFMSRGGVFLTGGIAQKIIPALKNGRFRAAFEDKAPHSDVLRAMPVHVITHPLAALAGLAAFASSPDRFGIKTAGRLWGRSSKH